jgi:Carboxypeptidase regulatory-like domain/TonB dependent receptor
VPPFRVGTNMKTLILAYILLTLAASAQVSSGTLAGKVADPSGLPLANARITATSDSTGFVRTAVTDASGDYSLADLAPGSYTISAQITGFRPVRVSSVTVDVQQHAGLDFRMERGGERDTVTVNASVSPLQTSDASEGHRLGSVLIKELPVETRNVIALVTLGPGAIPRQLSGFAHDIINDAQAARGATALNPPVNGARSTMNTFVVDGAYTTDRNTFAVSVIPPLESVQEFRAQSSLGSAEFAQSGGMVVDLVTKSGTQAWHGNAFEFFRNEAADARSYFDDPTLPRSIFRQNQFGGSIGGPAPLQSTFFYAAYEGLTQKSGKATLHLLPDPVVRSGDFTGRSPIFDPSTFDAATGHRAPFPGNIIPSARIDPIAARYLKSYEPLPTLSSAGGNYLDSTPNDIRSNNGSLRVDHQFRNRSSIFGRYTINDDRNLFAGNFPERPTAEQLRAQQAALGYTIAGAAWVNEARLSFTRLGILDLPQSAFGADVMSGLGISQRPTDPASFGLPYFVVTDFDTVTDANFLPQTQRDNTWHLSDGITVLRGRHTIRTGVQWIHFQLNYEQSQYARGRYIFNGAFTADPSNPGATGDGFADFLLGDAQATRRTVGSPMAYLRQNVYGSYFQDEWRVTPSLTLNLGLRYEYASPYSEARNRLVNLDYSALPAPPRLVSVSTAGEPDRNSFAPRAGIAWRMPRGLLNRTMVLRAGYGVYFSPEIAAEAYDLVRNNLRNEVNETTGPLPVLTLQNGFPTNAFAGFPTYYGLDPRARTPYVQQWSGSIQTELGQGLVLELSYVGSKGTKLGRFRTFNTPAHVETGENLPPRPGDLQSLRTFPVLGPIYQRQNIANSGYNSLQVKLDKRLSDRLSFLASFVWSKSIDDADSVIPGLGDSFGAQDERNLRLERGLSVFNVGRRVSAGFVYNLPSSPVAKLLLSHWSTSGIVTLQDGSPFNPVYFGTDIANSGTPNRPNVVPGQDVNLPASRRTAEQWFNAAAFQDPAPFTFGNAGRNTLPSPGVAIADLALRRMFTISEKATLQFRMEGFNVLNHPNWGIPGQYPDFGPFFGKIFTSGEPRRFQLGLRADF